MSIEELQIEILQLPENQRANLASVLLQSLSPIATDEDEGVSEALRRDAEMDRDPSAVMTHEEFIQSLGR